jgi:putative oxidoreductase
LTGALTPRAASHSFFNMQDIGRLVLRLTVAGLILFHGVSKIIHGIAWMSGPLAALHLPFFLAYGVYIGEVVAPLLVIMGLWTRIAALFIVINMIVAIGLEAWHLALTVNRGGGWGLELEAFYLLCAVAVFFLGAGKYRLGRGKGMLA